MNTLMDAMLANAPLIFGHRGARGYAPMNTIPAFELALAQGADGVELDVQRSADGTLVVIHDDTVDATTDGSGTVTEMSLAQLKVLDAGAWFSPEYANTQIPTLDDVFEAIGQRTWVNVEIKTTTPDSTGIESDIADCITRHALQSRILISSFNPFALRYFREVMPEVPIGYLFDPEWDTRALMDGMSYEAFHPHYRLIDAPLMQRAREAGHMVNTWTVNDADIARELQLLGVTTFITDYPDRLITALRG